MWRRKQQVLEHDFGADDEHVIGIDRDFRRL
jgi:hypothetical protein